MKEYKGRIVLVNLIAPEFLVRFQAPLAINVLSGYLSKKASNVDIEKIDMQEIFKNYNKCSDKNTSLSLTVNNVVSKIIDLSKDQKIIVGLSMKWATQFVARDIIKQVEEAIGKNVNLFVLGNVEATYGYKQLLQQEYFSDKVVVIGEGEDQGWLKLATLPSTKAHRL